MFSYMKLTFLYWPIYIVNKFTYGTLQMKKTSVAKGLFQYLFPFSFLVESLVFNRTHLCPEEDCVSPLLCSIMWPCDKVLLGYKNKWSMELPGNVIKGEGLFYFPSSSGYNVSVVAGVWIAILDYEVEAKNKSLVFYHNGMAYQPCRDYLQIFFLWGRKSLFC